MSSRCRHITLFIALLTLLANQNAFAFRCGNDLVSEGESKISVLNKCGKPDWIDRWSEEIIEFPDTDQEHRTTRINEHWVYNPGPTQFMRMITFTGSTVSATETGGRGFTTVPGIEHCDFDTLAIGTHSGEVKERCGEPDAKDQRYETITQKIPSGRKQLSVTVDEWTFNLGPTQFMRILTFHNGDLVEIRTGERGFSR